MNDATVKMSLHLSPETNEILEKLCQDNHLTKSDLLRCALALIEVALKYKKRRSSDSVDGYTNNLLFLSSTTIC